MIGMPAIVTFLLGTDNFTAGAGAGAAGGGGEVAAGGGTSSVSSCSES